MYPQAEDRAYRPEGFIDMPQQSEARRRLAALMDRRRLELRLTWQHVAERGNVSLRALANARTGDSDIRPLTQAGIENGLQWERGSVGIILDGGEPVPLAGSPGASLSRPHPEVPEPEGRNRADEDDDPGLAPYVQDVLRDLYTAAGIMPPLRPGEELPCLEETPEYAQLFGQIPGSEVFELEHEARTWDTHRIDAPAKVRAIARWRRLTIDYESRERNAMLGRP